MGPLDGVRVVELAGIGPAPFACMLLAELGAEVLRIERPGGGLAMGPPELELVNRGRRNVAMDLKNPAAIDAVLQLVAGADVLVEGFRPGVAERLGLGPEACHEVNPKLVYGRMTGWGQDGPLAQTAGHDIDYLALSGALHLIGRAGGPPQVPANLLGDFAGGSLYLVVGVLAALVEARGSGQGQVVDAAIVDGAAHLTTMLLGAQAGGSWKQERGTNLLDTGAPFYDVYETADSQYMAVGALEPQFYDELIRLLGITVPDRYDLASWPELRKVLTETFAQRTRAEWTEVFDGSDACVSPVLPLAGEHPHLAARGTFVEKDGVRQAAPTPRFSRTPSQLTEPPARPGQHTRAALTDWGVADVDELFRSGAAVQAD
ncbi:alpha-methylacyl-CoA racemase [Kribbella orskensis]|uniref:Alpha-methylacyl-CoA racemase n=1 Tax=Kribbella orskensis TaxID=2512216 RepID=A0ABY2BE37_9ACTN|nr:MULTISPECIES: CaiB/BaiF CoA-transferase family protein [Kribbella]TCN35883.1 alpha-methylacyl-CoA racemase [Kribbella sp. VKM Ac-2500]TCO17490.1 alpha-methylacyl-CoA racemase [Kribbella orskensis]